jgi:hypothetical protein
VADIAVANRVLRQYIQRLRMQSTETADLDILGETQAISPYE